LLLPRPAAARPLSSAKLPGDDVIDELRVAWPESDPAVAVDNERGEHTGRELLLELRQLSTPRSEDTREVVEAWVVPDEHDRADRLGKSLESLEQFPLRGGVELRDELDGSVLAERRLDRFERLARAKRGEQRTRAGWIFFRRMYLAMIRDARSPRGASGRSRSARVGSDQLDFPCRSRMTVRTRVTVPAGRSEVKKRPSSLFGRRSPEDWEHVAPPTNRDSYGRPRIASAKLGASKHG
jgi:hypothetical protein